MSGLLVLDEFFQTLLERAAVLESRKWTPASELDVNSIDHLPFLAHDEVSDGQVSNGPGLFVVNLTISLFATGKTAVNVVARDVYDIVHGWAADPSGAIEDIGWVTRVEDTSAFSTPSASSMLGKTVRQANGIFDVTIHTL